MRGQERSQRLILKLEIPLKGPREPWLLRDEIGSFVKKVSPQSLPTKVRESVRFANRGYFHAEIRGNSVLFGKRVIGDPGW